MAFHGKLALITGGASGMGRELALRLARSGARVAILDVSAQALETVAAEASGISPFVCDVSDSVAVRQTVETIEQEMGAIDRLAAAAAIMPARAVTDMPVEQFHKVMRVNYEGLVNTVKAVLPFMLQRRRGDLILFGSLAGVMHAQHFAAYCASKAAINAFGEVLANELRGSGLRILTVRPAAVNTPLIDQATGEGGIKGLRKQAASGRMATPGQIIDAIEAGLEKGREVLYPTAEARIAQLLRRLSPSLAWKIANSAKD